MALSKTQVIGRLTKDPEVKTLNINGEETQVANFTVACDEDFGDGTDFYDVVAWRQLATTVGNYMKKGRLVYVEGRTKTRTYPITKEGVEFTGRSTEIRASRVDFLDKAPTANQGTPDTQAANTQPAQTTQSTDPAPF